MKSTKQDTPTRQNRSVGHYYDENGGIGSMRSSSRDNVEKGDVHS